MPSTRRQKVSLFVVEFGSDNTPSREESRMIVERILANFAHKNTATLTHDELGKPSIVDEQDLSISYAHSKSCLVLAVGESSAALGVDTESPQRSEEIAGLKELAFSAYEQEKINEKDYVFMWCLKEAAVKQLGTGFRYADPSQYSIETLSKSYKISLDNKYIFRGYFIDTQLHNQTIVLCSEYPITELFVDSIPLDYFMKGQA